LPEVTLISDDSKIISTLESLQEKEMSQEEQDFWIKMSIYEIEAQAEFARVSLENIFRKGSENNNLVFSSIHPLLSHCAVISKLLKADSNGITIGSILKIKDDSIIHKRKYRNNMEHYDQELKKWIKEKGINAAIGMDNIGSKSAIGVPNMFFIRHFDNQTHTFTLLDEDFNLVSLLEEIRIIKKKASTWVLTERMGKIHPPFKSVFH
jgi:hypothetical protein